MAVSSEDKELIARRSKGGIEIMKASAGSGKTYALTQEYIRLLLSRRNSSDEKDGAYRHILAVTFTNKATEEMKARIIKELDVLCKDTAKSDYRDYLMESCGYRSDKELSAAADEAMKAVLNDYGSFSVSTIDSFCQRVLRAFARESGQFPDYRVELDRESLVEEAADLTLENLAAKDPALLEFIMESFGDLLQDGYGARMDFLVRAFAKGLLSEGYVKKAKDGGIDLDDAMSSEELKALLTECQGIIARFDVKLGNAARNAISVLDANSGIISKNAAKGMDALKGIDFRQELDPCSCMGGTLFSGKGVVLTANLSNPAAVVVADAVGNVRDLLNSDELKLRNTALLIRRQAYTFILAERIRQSYAEILSERHMLGIEDSNSLLSKIIGEADAPFIYEKVGTRYENYLLDEFQDTSNVQWRNFLPLLENSVASGGYDLTVGDVKQSIYRWRDADWKILDSGVASAVRGAFSNTLQKNWRSAKNVVEFNNEFYPVLASDMAGLLADEGAPDASKVCAIYSDVKQQYKGVKGTDGSVAVSFFANRSVKEEAVVAAVREARARGFSLSDIAVLVRSNDDGSRCASVLGAAGFNVITSDSLMLGSNKFLLSLVGSLYRLLDEDDRTHSFNAVDFDRDAISTGGSMEDVVERMVKLIGNPEEMKKDTAYILAFRDLVHSYEADHGNSLQGFLKYWEDTGRRKSVQSPQGTDAVTITTIHKSKGLEYPFVIALLPEAFFRQTEVWAKPTTSGTPLDGKCNALFRVNLSSTSKNTLFAQEYLKELGMSYIDTANIAYVATTRAEQALHIITKRPGASGTAGLNTTLRSFIDKAGDSFVKAGPLVEGKDEKGRNLCETFRMGGMPAKVIKEAKLEKFPVSSTSLEYAVPDGDSVVSIKEGGSASEYFSDGAEDYGCSNRIRGIVLHSVLENVLSPGDLHKAVLNAVESGSLPEKDAPEAERLLSSAIASVASREWFPANAEGVFDEREIVIRDDGRDGESGKRRPDRVVLKADGSIEIVDYKFGRPDDAHAMQVREYMDLYRRMGYSIVRGYVWYIGSRGRIVEVQG